MLLDESTGEVLVVAGEALRSGYIQDLFVDIIWFCRPSFSFSPNGIFVSSSRKRTRQGGVDKFKFMQNEDVLDDPQLGCREAKEFESS